ncbi:nuclear-pore anchor-like [Magnolia sinica]|uniref:nuclear-pore anchor-like n=1 Tax=Magnolia sinica TaxID=86752 RepID=UPI00265A66CA|nr:nuclear-pore anchor-like [Magnolia sinica]
MEKLKGEAQANKDHMLQYKEIAQVNEVALKQIESAHEKFKAEADKLKKSLEDEIHFLKGRVSELESDLMSKSTEVISTVLGKKEALSSSFAEIDRLKEENFVKT